MTLSTLCPSYMRSANGDESYAHTAEGNMLAEVCCEEKHATSRHEEIAAAFCIL